MFKRIIQGIIVLAIGLGLAGGVSAVTAAPASAASKCSVSVAHVGGVNGSTQLTIKGLGEKSGSYKFQYRNYEWHTVITGSNPYTTPQRSVIEARAWTYDRGSWYRCNDWKDPTRTRTQQVRQTVTAATSGWWHLYTYTLAT